VKVPKLAVAVTMLVVVPTGSTTPDLVQVFVSPGVRVNEQEAFGKGGPNVPQVPVAPGGTMQKSSARFPGVPLSSTRVALIVTVAVAGLVTEYV
jgi:hypothetical protein